MTQSITKAPSYPKAHLLAASGVVALLSLSLLVFPAGEVEAKKTNFSLELIQGDEASTDYSESISPFAEIEESTDSPFAKTEATNRKTESTEPATAAPEPSKVSIKVVSGDTMTKVFNRAGAPQAALLSSKDLGRLEIQPGQVFDFSFSSNGELDAVHSELTNLHSITLKRADNGYVFKSTEIKPEIRSVYASGAISSSLSDAAGQAGIPYGLALNMADIFAYDIDFSRVAKGDSFEVIYEEKIVDGKVVGTGNILAARFTNLRQGYTAFRYTNGSYYNEKGMSLRKAFLRTPVDFARISSRFSSGRKHPILNKIRAHQGVDFAAPRGTPIKAAGDGKVILAGRKGGYGNTVILQHGSSYKTLYGHMNGFAKGIRTGSKVRQGQIIGYIGTTGLSTGPHLHYEFQINGRHVDPLAQKGMMADPIAQSDKNKFMQLSKPLLARLNQERDSAPTLAMSKL